MSVLKSLHLSLDLVLEFKLFLFLLSGRLEGEAGSLGVLRRQKGSVCSCSVDSEMPNAANLVPEWMVKIVPFLLCKALDLCRGSVEHMLGRCKTSSWLLGTLPVSFYWIVFSNSRPYCTLQQNNNKRSYEKTRHSFKNSQNSISYFPIHTHTGLKGSQFIHSYSTYLKH